MHNSDVIAEIVFWHNIPQGTPPFPNNVNWSQFSYSYARLVLLWQNKEGLAPFNFINKMPLLCKLTELTKCYETWEMQAIPVLQVIVGHHSQKESQPIKSLYLKKAKHTPRGNPLVLLNC